MFIYLSSYSQRNFILPFLPPYIIPLIPSIIISALKMEDSTLLQNVDFYQPVHTALKPRRTSSLFSFIFPPQKVVDEV
jgi:hypothetical protein